MEVWRNIPEFRGYSVSNYGSVRNDETNHRMALMRNQRGFVIVGLMKDCIQHKRSVTVLVADKFLPPPPEAYDTPIHLDGDRTNNRYFNLTWRPRWFAIKYYKQFQEPRMAFARPLVEISSGEFFNNSREASVKYGILEREIYYAVMKNTYVWPTYQRFKLL